MPEIKEEYAEAARLVRTRGRRAKNVFVGIASAGGSFRSATSIRRGGLDVVTKGADTFIVLKDAPGGEGAPAASQKMGEEKDQDWTEEVVQPRWPFSILHELLVSNTVHAACIETKAADYAFGGWRLTRVPEVERLLKERKRTEDEVNAAEEEANRFLESCFEGEPVESLLRQVAIDYETFGIAGFEPRRTPKGLVAALSHIPFQTVLKTSTPTYKGGGARYVQIRGQHKRYFMEFGEKIAFTDPAFDPRSSPIDAFPSLDKRADFVRWSDRQVDAKTGKTAAADADGTANEILSRVRPPITKSELYGTPAGIQAVGSMLALQQIESYNLQFFAAKGVPQYAVIVEGLPGPGPAPMQETEDGAEAEDIHDEAAAMQQVVSEFFMDQLLAADRSVLFFSTWGDAKVRFEKLSADDVEAAFEKYEDRGIEMIRIAHRVPKAVLGLVTEPAIVGSGSVSAQLRRYRDHIVAPGQRQLAHPVNLVLRCGLLIPYFRFEFLPMEIEGEAQRREFLLKEFVAGSITLNQYLKELGRPEVEGGDVHIIRTGNVMTIGEEAGTAAAAFRAMRKRDDDAWAAVAIPLVERLVPLVAAEIARKDEDGQDGGIASEDTGGEGEA